MEFVATWRGSHTSADRHVGEVVGECTCELISPEWIITAGHCAERVLKHEAVDVKINFHGQNPHVERSVTSCIHADGDQDVAICKLTRPVEAFLPLKINPAVYKTGHKTVFVVGLFTTHLFVFLFTNITFHFCPVHHWDNGWAPQGRAKETGV
jgi:hypothetical protein